MEVTFEREWTRPGLKEKSSETPYRTSHIPEQRLSQMQLGTEIMLDRKYRQIADKMQMQGYKYLKREETWQEGRGECEVRVSMGDSFSVKHREERTESVASFGLCGINILAMILP